MLSNYDTYIAQSVQLSADSNKHRMPGPHRKSLTDNRKHSPFQTMQLKALDRTQTEKLIQKVTNDTGLPDNLKSGIENLSGYSMDDVKVHYNSDKPAKLSAHAYAQGTNIHLATGQERHLPHEAWHVVQQKQGRVKPTFQMKNKIGINDDVALEREADLMGNKLEFFRVNPQFRGFDQTISSMNSFPSTTTVQLIPNKEALYWQRLLQMAGPAPTGLGQSQHLIGYILNPVNRRNVGRNVVHNVRMAINNVAPNPLDIIGLQLAITNSLNALMAQPGQYAADTAHNASLTAALMRDPFIQDIMSGTLQGGISGQQNTTPVLGAIPPPVAGMDDRVLEAIDLFNRITNLPNALPAINVTRTLYPDAAMGNQGDLDLGWAAARATIVHELGHHLENNLGPAEFVSIHNFLTSRTQMPLGGLANQMSGMRQDVGYIFEHHPGYQIEMPPIDVSLRMLQSTPMRYGGLAISGLWQQLGRLVSYFSGRREPRNWGSWSVENFFVHNANNRQLSYSTATHDFGNAANYDGSTEYLSTTTEFFSRPDHIAQLVQRDPLRVALFLYIGNRPVYMRVEQDFNNHNPGLRLRALIHAVE